jgi:glycosyltransferase involved in cell wall biosynthesis
MLGRGRSLQDDEISGMTQLKAAGSELPKSDWSVLVLSRHEPQAASSRLRTYQYFPALRDAGAEVHNAPFFDEHYLRRLYVSRDRGAGDLLRAYMCRVGALLRARRHDVVWVEKETLPFAPGLLERFLGLAGVPYVVDYDDATFHTYDEHRRAVVRRLLGQKLNPLLSGAFAVTAGNRYLSDYAQNHGAKRVVRVPTVVDLSRYPATEYLRGAELRIGWIGTPATAKYLEILREPLRQLGQRIRLKLVTVGAPAGLDFGVPVEHHPWSEATEANLLAGVDVGVMPLPDAPWERGKCGYKLIQYMAVGKPVIASPVGVNRELVVPTVGTLAADCDAWVSAIEALALNPVLAADQGRAGRSLVEQTYSLQAQAPVVTALLREAAKSRQ